MATGDRSKPGQIKVFDFGLAKLTERLAPVRSTGEDAVLMINGRHDFIFPLETNLNVLFRLLGAPAKDKRHALLDSGHFPFPMRDAIKEILNWLDRYLGPVQPQQSAPGKISP